MDPINYTGNQGQNAFLQSFAPYVGMASQIQQNQLNEQQLAQRQAEFQAQQEAARQAQEQARLAAIAQAEKQAKIQAAAKDVFGGNWNPESQAYLIANLPADQLKASKDLWDSRNGQARQDFVNNYGGAYAALANGSPDTAKQILQNRLDALSDSQSPNDQQEATSIKGMLGMIDQNPKMAQGWLSTGLATTKEGNDYLDSLYKQKGQPSEIALREAQAAEAWANALRQKAGSGLSNDADKIINSATDNVSGSILLASQADNLASAFEQARPVGGWTGNVLETLKRIVGGQDKFTSLKQEYVKLRNTDVLKNLPPGVASDKDIEIALKAFPDENANPDQIAAFLRGTAKLNRYNAEVNKARAEWVAQNGNLGPMREPNQVVGKQVKKGTSFWDFTSSIPIPNVAGGAPAPTTSSAPATGGQKPAPATGSSSPTTKPSEPQKKVTVTF